MESRKRLFLYLSMLALLWFSPACSAPGLVETPPTPTFEAVSQPPEGKYLFVEIWLSIEGDSARLERANYWFDPETMILDPNTNKEHFPLAQNPDAWGLVGEGANTDSGAYNWLFMIEKLPYETMLKIFTSGTDETNHVIVLTEIPVNLLAVSENGTLKISVHGDILTLAAGERWEHIAEGENSSSRPIRTTSSITNYGWLDKADIKLDP